MGLGTFFIILLVVWFLLRLRRVDLERDKERSTLDALKSLETKVDQLLSIKIVKAFFRGQVRFIERNSGLAITCQYPLKSLKGF